MTGDSSFWKEESSNFPPMKRRRRRKTQKKLEFIGWGSKPLIQFLQSIGRDTSMEFSRMTVENIIDQYANDRNLIQKKNKSKKRIICDGLLSDLFGKKSVFRVHVSKLLETHLAEFQSSSEDDSQSDSGEEEYGAKKVDKKASNNGSRPSCQKKKVSKNCSASVCAKNLKFVYLKKSLVLDLLKAEESFADKVIGSFVRIKCDPNDYLQKYSHQLLQVVGVRMSSEADNDGKVYLQLSNFVNEIAIEMLSDADFLEEECEDLRERVKAGLHRWPTFVEFEAKAGMLHRDIMKHWIPRQLLFLKKRIDRANEKGWRKELFDLLAERKVLEKASEQEKLISEMPEIAVDTLDPQAIPSASIASDMGEKDTSSPIFYDWEACDNYYSDDAGSGDVKAQSAATTSNLVDEIENSGITNGVASEEAAVNGSGDIKVPSAATTSYLAAYEVKHLGITNGVASIEATNDGQNSNIMQIGNVGESGGDEMNREVLVVDLDDGEVLPAESERVVNEIPIIELSDDDEPEAAVIEYRATIEEPEVVMENRTTIDEPEAMIESDSTVIDVPEMVIEYDVTIDDAIWCYKDPHGDVQGPYALRIFRQWYEKNYFDSEFVVWKNGESSDQAVLLVDLFIAFSIL